MGSLEFPSWSGALWYLSTRRGVAGLCLLLVTVALAGTGWKLARQRHPQAGRATHTPPVSSSDLETTGPNDASAHRAAPEAPALGDKEFAFVEKAALRDAATMEGVLGQAQDLKEQLLARVKDPKARALIQIPVEQHQANIEEYRKTLAATQDEEKAACLLADIGSEYWQLFRKTPRELPICQDYLQHAIEALEQATRKSPLAAAAYSLGDYCLTYGQCDFPAATVNDRQINANLAVEYYLLTYDWLVRSEGGQGAGEAVAHPYWLVRGTMQGLERALTQLKRADEFEKIQSGLLSRYQGTMLGKQLNDFFGEHRSTE